MAPHSSTLAWKIPWMEEPGRLQSMGLQRVRHDRATSLSLFTFLHWRRKWQPTPVFLPGESQGQRSLVGYGPRGRTESDTTEATQQQHFVVKLKDSKHNENIFLNIQKKRLITKMKIQREINNQTNNRLLTCDNESQHIMEQYLHQGSTTSKTECLMI